jgi:hypothetical protein
LARRVAYDSSRAALYRPGEADDFFALGPIASPAALCAEMARLAYVKDPARLEAFLQRQGFSRLRQLDAGGTQGFVAEGPFGGETVCVAAFRGTESGDPADLFADARFALSAWEAGGRVHTGFAAAFGWVRDAFLEATQGRATLLLTGHSLGAALATLAASLLPPSSYGSLRPGARLVTFGCPRVGDADFKRATAGIAHDRYVNCCDKVTELPPETLLGFHYVHTGQLHFFDAAGLLREEWTAEQMKAERRSASFAYLRELGLLNGQVAVRELADHAPINYVSVVP